MHMIQTMSDKRLSYGKDPYNHYACFIRGIPRYDQHPSSRL
jgi:hypothetical protein